MPIGKVKWYDPDRGFGFISNPDGDDCYVGKSVLPHGVTELHRGQRVDFDFASGARGPQALRVKILDEPRPRSRNRQTKHKYTPEELGSLIADMVTTLEERVQPPLTAGRYPDRNKSRKHYGSLPRSWTGNIETVNNRQTPSCRQGQLGVCFLYQEPHQQSRAAQNI